MNAPDRRLSTKTAATLLVLVSMLVSGCSITMKHDELMQPTRKFDDPIGLSKHSEGIKGKVGWGRISLFYIPVVPIYIEGDGNELVMKQIGDALKQVGYQVTQVDAESATVAPTLKCKVNEFWFNNYTWLLPFIPTWGEIKLTTSLVSSSGKVLWSQDFEGDGFTMNFFNGYTSAAEQSMTEILNELVKAFSSDAFHVALTEGKH